MYQEARPAAEEREQRMLGQQRDGNKGCHSQARHQARHQVGGVDVDVRASLRPDGGAQGSCRQTVRNCLPRRPRGRAHETDPPEQPPNPPTAGAG